MATAEMESKSSAAVTGEADNELLHIAADLTIAWLSNPNTRVTAEDVPAFLEKIHGAVLKLGVQPPKEEEAVSVGEFSPAVSVRRSLASKDHIISLIDGKPYKTLKRHLSTNGLTPEEYRDRYGLRSDYPMVAENYAAMRRDMAKKIGLGRKPKNAAAPAKSPAARKPGRPRSTT